MQIDDGSSSDGNALAGWDCGGSWPGLSSAHVYVSALREPASCRNLAYQSKDWKQSGKVIGTKTVASWTEADNGQVKLQAVGCLADAPYLIDVWTAETVKPPPTSRVADRVLGTLDAVTVNVP